MTRLTAPRLEGRDPWAPQDLGLSSSLVLLEAGSQQESG